MRWGTRSPEANTWAALDRRVTLLRAAVVDDGLQSGPDWDEPVTLGTVWASKADISDGERWRAGQVQAHVTTRFRLRWSSVTAGLTAKDRVTCEGRTYDIVAVKEIGRREGVEITAAARTD